MVNLLPETAQHSLHKAYYQRLGVFALFLAALAAGSSAALLLPSYIFATADLMAAKQSFSDANAAVSPLSVSDRAAITQASEGIQLMRTYPRSPRIASLVAAAMHAATNGVVVTQVMVVPAPDGSAAVSISGKAADREALLSLEGALRTSGTFTGVSVPLSDLAGNADIPFALSFSSLPTP